MKLLKSALTGAVIFAAFSLTASATDVFPSRLDDAAGGAAPKLISEETLRAALRNVELLVASGCSAEEDDDSPPPARAQKASELSAAAKEEARRREALKIIWGTDGKYYPKIIGQRIFDRTAGGCSFNIKLEHPAVLQVYGTMQLSGGPDYTLRFETFLGKTPSAEVLFFSGLEGSANAIHESFTDFCEAKAKANAVRESFADFCEAKANAVRESFADFCEANAIANAIRDLFGSFMGFCKANAIKTITLPHLSPAEIGALGPQAFGFKKVYSAMPKRVFASMLGDSDFEYQFIKVGSEEDFWGRKVMIHSKGPMSDDTDAFYVADEALLDGDYGIRRYKNGSGSCYIYDGFGPTDHMTEIPGLRRVYTKHPDPVLLRDHKVNNGKYHYVGEAITRRHS